MLPGASTSDTKGYCGGSLRPKNPHPSPETVRTPRDDKGRLKFFVEKGPSYEHLIRAMATGSSVPFTLVANDGGEELRQEIEVDIFLVNGGPHGAVVITSYGGDFDSSDDTYVGNYHFEDVDWPNWPHDGLHGYFLYCESTAEGVDLLKEMWTAPSRLPITYHCG